MQHPINKNINHDKSTTASTVPSVMQTPNIYSIQNMMQMQMMNKVMSNLSFIQTDDPMINNIMTIVVQTIIILLNQT
jgi:hypothetical protein